jgi:hypothetical protein
MTNSLIALHSISPNDEPRVLDTDLAERLGFERPRAIRQLIQRHTEALGRFGPIATQRGVYRGHDFDAYYLNKRQAIFIIQKSDAPNAIELTIEITEVYAAWLDGSLEPRQQKQQPAIPQDYASALRLAADEHERLALPGHSDAKI